MNESLMFKAPTNEVGEKMTNKTETGTRAVCRDFELKLEGLQEHLRQHPYYTDSIERTMS